MIQYRLVYRNERFVICRWRHSEFGTPYRMTGWYPCGEYDCDNDPRAVAELVVQLNRPTMQRQR